MAKISKKDMFFYGLTGIGIVVSLLTELEKISPAVRSLCGGDTGGCAEVGASQYSSFFGVPLGIWGIVAYITLVVLYRFQRSLSPVFAGLMMGVEVFLVYLMFGVLKTVCPLCMANFFVVASIFIFLSATAVPDKAKEKYRAAAMGAALVAFLLVFVPHHMAYGNVEMNVESITSWGDPSSPYRMEVYADYQCPHCAHFDHTIKEVIQKYPELYIVFRDFILGHNEMSPMAVSYTGSVAYLEGKERYLQARFETFANQGDLFNYLSPKFRALPDNPEMKKAVTEKVRNDRAEAQKVGVSSTPTTVLIKNGKVEKVISGYVPFEAIKRDLDKFTGHEGN